VQIQKAPPVAGGFSQTKTSSESGAVKVRPCLWLATLLISRAARRTCPSTLGTAPACASAPAGNTTRLPSVQRLHHLCRDGAPAASEHRRVLVQAPRSWHHSCGLHRAPVAGCPGRSAVYRTSPYALTYITSVPYFHPSMPWCSLHPRPRCAV
jgi:hypothetical protein